MKALVLYDSVYGNTEKIALAIAAGLNGKAEAAAAKIGAVKAEQIAQADLLVVGSPTQAFKPLKSVSAFLYALPNGSLKGKQAAAFDTRADIKEVNNKLLTFLVGRFGYAAEPIDKALQKKDAVQVVKPEGFFIIDKEGPLREGELERAAAWGAHLVS